MSVASSLAKSLARSVAGSVTIGDSGGVATEVLSKPSGFASSWTLPFTVSKTGSSYSTDYDPADKLPSGWESYTTEYVDGSGSAGSGTEASPRNSIYTAVHNRSANMLVYVKPGTYTGTQGWNGAIAGTFGATAYDVIVRRWPQTTLE